MYLFYGVLFLCLTALLFAATLLGVRNPVRPFWAKEDLFDIVLTPLILGFFVMGIACCAKAFVAEVQPGLQEWGYAAIAAVVTVVSIKMMGIRKKLEAFSAQETSRGEVIQFDFQANRSPETPTKNTPDFRKAA